MRTPKPRCMKTAFNSTLAMLCVSAVAYGQGFINLDFEDAIIEPWPPDSMFLFLDWRLAAPGWSHSDGSSTSIIYYRQGHLGVAQIFLLYDSSSPVWAPGTQLSGNYSLGFASGFFGDPESSPWVNAFISQSGTIPDSARSIRLLARGPFQVFVGGAEIEMLSLGGNAFGGDVSGFAGDTAELKIVNTATVGFVHHYAVVDNISFSPVPIPEPGSVGLFTAGLAVLGACFRRRGRRNRGAGL